MYNTRITVLYMGMPTNVCKFTLMKISSSSTTKNSLSNCKLSENVECA